MKTYIGIDLGGTNVRVAKVDEEGNVLQVEKARTNANATADEIVGAIAEIIKKIDGYQETEGVGIAVPGPVKPDGSGLQECANIPVLSYFPLKEKLEVLVNLPVYVGNDADAAGLAEALIGAGKGYRSVVYITLSTGIGGAFIYEGKLLVGGHGVSMEVGSICIDPKKKNYTMPGTGAVQDYGSGVSIVRMAKEAMPERDFTHAGEVFDLAAAGNEKAQAIVDYVIDNLAILFSNLSVVLDPEVFVLVAV